MDLKALYKLSYGVYVVTSKKHNRINGQIANTVSQATSEPHSWHTTTLIGSHPKAAYAVPLTNALRPKTRFASIIGSYGWCSQAKEQIINMIPSLKEEPLEPVIVKGLPEEEGFKALDALASTIAQKHKNFGEAAT
jgi:flavorubredoxin